MEWESSLKIKSHFYISLKNTMYKALHNAYSSEDLGRLKSARCTVKGFSCLPYKRDPFYCAKPTKEAMKVQDDQRKAC